MHGETMKFQSGC